MYDYIFILGAPGSGKTTIARLLKEQLECPHIDFDWIRSFHLNKDWSNASEEDVILSRENLLALLHNYKQHNRPLVIVSGLTEPDLEQIVDTISSSTYLVITLYLTDEDELKRRVLSEARDSGFRNVESALATNTRLGTHITFPHEYKFDNSSKNVINAVDEIKRLLSNTNPTL